MAKLTKAPPMAPIKPLPTAKPPPVSKTQDTYTHHTSPVQGPQTGPPEVNPISSSPKVKIKTLPDVPMHVTKHDGNGNGY
jgi:hypothetical protein